ncbi:TonB-dependent receptor [Diaphorobacter nitroreducens]|uniref:TonB-dependent receptor plug domain-containing protein n=1 Tax=Diaphorobacter nitroreducens TaxID=164759 RepID=UPI000B5A0385|nr:TonB-dependent receptor [Diaphorobacter nitroreducens]ASI67856.1 TonB-dependent receptor [Diaphorobacter nitroreducens]
MTNVRLLLKPLTSTLVALGLCATADHVAAADGVFELGTVTVVGETAFGEASAETQLTQDEITRNNADTVADAVRLLPGVSLTRNSRNEEMLYLRGFDARQVPVYVDGVPLYVPYDGYVDFGRFTTFDLAEIRVAKAGASLLYGPNTLGGAINLVTRKPVKAFEGDARLGLGAGQTRKAAVNLGGNQGLWYYQLGASYLDADGFPLPKGFKDYKRNPTDTGSRRENAYRTDKRLSFKLGLTPNATDEYALGYVRQEGEKGNPVYTGTSAQKNAVRYWRWPYWDKDSVYFLSTTRIGSNNVLKTRLYHDTYKNGLDMYRDAGYTQHDPTSSYKDTSKGATVEWANYSLQGHELRFAAHYKRDEHDDEGKFYRDVTTSLVAEDTITLSERWQLSLGMSHEKRDAKKVHQWPKGSADATNGLARLSYALTQSGDEVYAIASHKTRFPTIKDRYSARMGRALPNPDLRPETANHLELGVSGQPWPGGRGQAAVFYSRMNDQIQTVVVPSSACGGSTCNQAQNVGRTRNMGLELSLAQQLSAQWSMNASYTYLDRTNLSDRRVTLTETPRHRLFAALNWLPSAQWELRATLEAEQGRRVNFDGGTYRQLGGFGTAGLKAVYKPVKDFALDFSVNNLGDKWYELADGYPMPGRFWYINGTYRF